MEGEDGIGGRAEWRVRRVGRGERFAPLAANVAGSAAQPLPCGRGYDGMRGQDQLVGGATSAGKRGGA